MDFIYRAGRDGEACTVRATREDRVPVGWSMLPVEVNGNRPVIMSAGRPTNGQPDDAEEKKIVAEQARLNRSRAVENLKTRGELPADFVDRAETSEIERIA